jgi:hypothetical protein
MSADDNKALGRQALAEVRDGWTQAAVDQFFAPSYRRRLTRGTAPGAGRAAALTGSRFEKMCECKT